jgi:hypothetical protein
MLAIVVLLRIPGVTMDGLKLMGRSFCCGGRAMRQ